MQSLAAVHVRRSDGLTSGTQDGVDLPFAGPLPQLAHAHALRPRMRRERAVLDGGRARGGFQSPRLRGRSEHRARAERHGEEPACDEQAGEQALMSE
jgi:hypothetical protein